MLADLRIENLAVVRTARAEFGEGLNVISGETGAGKSILLQAFNLITGGRASSDLVRHGADFAIVEARFELRPKDEVRVNRELGGLGLPTCDDGLIIRRRLSKDGKSKVYINDASATVAALSRTTLGLVEHTGQHAQLGLLRPRRHLELLDAFADVEPLRSEVADCVARLRKAERQLLAIEAALKDRIERSEFLRFFLKEYEELAPEPLEDEVLLKQADRYRNSERSREGLGRALGALYEAANSAYDMVGIAAGQLQDLTRFDQEMGPLASELESAQTSIEEVARTLTRYRDNTNEDSADLESLEDRLHRIQRLCRKHGAPLDAVMEKMNQARQELDSLDDLDIQLLEANKELETVREEATRLAGRLTEKRSQTIPKLISRAQEHLDELGLNGCRFELSHEVVSDPAEYSETGADRIVFLFSSNPSAPARPLAKVASGGELSRMLLAIKCALAEIDTVPVKVFDEIGTGLGGGIAEVVGRKIRQLADGSQVLCVTHLPQIASFADNHLVVSKELHNEEPITSLINLTDEEREREVARMLGGTEITDTTRQHAREMLVRSRIN